MADENKEKKLKSNLSAVTYGFIGLGAICIFSVLILSFVESMMQMVLAEMTNLSEEQLSDMLFLYLLKDMGFGTLQIGYGVAGATSVIAGLLMLKKVSIARYACIANSILLLAGMVMLFIGFNTVMANLDQSFGAQHDVTVDTTLMTPVMNVALVFSSMAYAIPCVLILVFLLKPEVRAYLKNEGVA